jgi:hypothetical protein
MRATSILKAMLLIGPLAAAGCGSRASQICDLVCECEHCNDYAEDINCIQLQAQQDIAETYECSDQYEAWATCVEEKGECDEDEARFSTSGNGSCSGSLPLGISCAADADCGGFSATCQSGMCVQRVCAGTDDQFSCETDSDCPGQDRCTDEEQELSECISDSSAHGGPIFDFD